MVEENLEKELSGDELLDEPADNDNDNDYDDDDDKDEYTWDEVMDLKKQAKALKKAEKKLVELKRQLKQKEMPASNSKDEVLKILKEEKFFDKNPDAVAYKNKIVEYQNKGLSLEEAYLLASSNDKQVQENREVYGVGVVKGKSAETSISKISIDAFDRLPVTQQKDYMDKMTSKYGKVSFK